MTDDDWTDEPDDPLSGDKPAGEPVVRFEADPWVRDRIAEMNRREDQSMPGWLPAALVAAVAWVGLGIWLMRKTGWPDSYGYGHPNCVRLCILDDMVNSPALLERPNSYSLALFAWYAVMAAFAVWVIVRAVSRKPRGQVLHALGLIAVGLALLFFLHLQGIH